MTAWDPTDRTHRDWMREALDERHDWDLGPIAAVLHCSPTKESVLATLDVLDGVGVS